MRKKADLGREKLGSFQQKILEIISQKKKSEWTAHEIAKVLYGRPIKSDSTHYNKITRALRALKERGIVEHSQIEVKWKLKPLKP